MFVKVNFIVLDRYIKYDMIEKVELFWTIGKICKTYQSFYMYFNIFLNKLLKIIERMVYQKLNFSNFTLKNFIVLYKCVKKFSLNICSAL